MNKPAMIGKFLAASALAVAATVACAQPGSTASSPTPGYRQGYGPGSGVGPGMMRGYGPASGYGQGTPGGGRRGYGSGYGPGYGMGPWGWGGGFGMGPGMMGGAYGGFPMGFGMMGGGCGGYGMWGGGPGFAAAIGLTDAQKKQIEAIEDAQAKKQWALMTTMHDQMLSARKIFDSDDINVDAVMKTAKSLEDARLEMLRNRLEAGKQIRGVLTKEQQQKLRNMRGWGWQ